ncbi:MAG: hypothetical protein ABJA79_00310 [Parafilimonas sp.]
MKKNYIIGFIILIVIACAGYGLYVWNKPERDVRKEEGIRITATAIFDSFTNNEKNANVAFLNKAIQVTGLVADVKKNQAGETVVYLQSSDPIYGINCSFKEDPGQINKGSTITFKGICTGYLSDVIINEGVLMDKK